MPAANPGLHSHYRVSCVDLLASSPPSPRSRPVSRQRVLRQSMHFDSGVSETTGSPLRWRPNIESSDRRFGSRSSTSSPRFLPSCWVNPAARCDGSGCVMCFAAGCVAIAWLGRPVFFFFFSPLRSITPTKKTVRLRFRPGRFFSALTKVGPSIRRYGLLTGGPKTAQLPRPDQYHLTRHVLR